jgi:hypothetical protein
MTKGLVNHQDNGAYGSKASHTETMSYNPRKQNTHVIMLSYGETAEFVLAARKTIEQDAEKFKDYKKALRPFEKSYGYKLITLTDVLQEECKYILQHHHNGEFCTIGDNLIFPGHDINVARPSSDTLRENFKDGKIGAILAAHCYDI